eukprot:TRINITY_DN7285_c0_g1_i10.p1 TRINITY_DN7285_c0_g1~~TRINITY_DN7285_c0_g1_i10.p1  ORF type:complete len:757 (+),score=192.22 TRINITY_DN7285_c0_g1_i10:1358-3628(+)
MLFMNSLLHSAYEETQQEIMNDLCKCGFYNAFQQLSTLFNDDTQWVAQVEAFGSFEGWPKSENTTTSKFTRSTSSSSGMFTLVDAHELIRKLRRELRTKDEIIENLKNSVVTHPGSSSVTDNDLSQSRSRKRFPAPGGSLVSTLGPPLQYESHPEPFEGPPSVDLPPLPGGPPLLPGGLPTPLPPLPAPAPAPPPPPLGGLPPPLSGLRIPPGGPPLSPDGTSLPTSGPIATSVSPDGSNVPRGPPPPPGGLHVRGGPAPHPPPPLGPPGGPPPPGMSKGPVLPEGFVPKDNKQLQKKMKPVLWQKIQPPKIKGTFWERYTGMTQPASQASLDEQRTVKDTVALDIANLEEFFGVSRTKPVEEEQQMSMRESLRNKSEKAEILRLLDGNRSNMIEIMLKGLKMDIPSVHNLLVTLDCSMVTVDKIVAICQNLPTTEELQILADYNGDRDKLGNAEKYFLTIGAVPFLELRSCAIKFYHTFESVYENLVEGVDVLTGASKLICNSKQLQIMLCLVLDVGNYMNSGTNRGASYGFKIDIIPSLGDVRSIKNPQLSLLNYLCRSYQNMFGVDLLIQFIQEMKSSTMQIALKEDMNELLAGIRELEKQLKPIINHLDQDCSVEFKNRFGTWIESKVKPEMKQLSDKSNFMQEEFKKMFSFFGESPSTNPKDFLSIFYNFGDAIEKAHIQNKKMEIEEKKIQESPPVLIEEPIKKPHPKQDLDVTETGAEGELDSIIKLMKKGQFNLSSEHQAKRKTGFDK